MKKLILSIIITGLIPISLFAQEGSIVRFQREELSIEQRIQELYAMIFQLQARILELQKNEIIEPKETEKIVPKIIVPEPEETKLEPKLRFKEPKPLLNNWYRWNRRSPVYTSPS